MKKIKLLLVGFILLSFVFPKERAIKAQNDEIGNAYAVNLLSDVYEWHFKMINGKLHRRKLNTSTNTWGGYWEPV